MNRWVVTDDLEFATWNFYTPKLEEARKLEWALELVSQFTGIGKTTRVWDLLETKTLRDFPGFNLSDWNSYTDYVRDLAEATGRIHILPTIDNAQRDERGIYRTPGVISYFNDHGDVEERSIEDIGAIRKQLGDKSNPLLSKYSVSKPPVTTGGTIMYLQEDTPTLLPLSIDLYTDIWFPCVFDYLDFDPPFGINRCRYENSLAQYHTLRLNEFLSKVYRLVTDMGCKWEFFADSRYKDMVSITGINL